MMALIHTADGLAIALRPALHPLDGSCGPVAMGREGV